MPHLDHTRRRILAASCSVVGLSLISPFLRAAGLTATPAQTPGPFYPLQLPLDHDNDLVSVEGAAGIAKGQITNIIGRVLDDHGRPLPQARIEIWQVNAYGRYHHPQDRQDKPWDPNFQGYGQTLSGPDGAYRFRTIKPVPYPGRTPHIHFAVRGPGFERLVTQMYIAGAPENERDPILSSIHNPDVRRQVIVNLEKASVHNELVGKFDIILSSDGRFIKG
jgi:protocatechuate 3,4-dioxygenase, beta subunit